MLTATTERRPVDGCNCGCCAEVRGFLAAKRQVLFGCHCDAHPPEERCDCAFCAVLQIACECGATPDPSESPGTGMYEENGVAKFICLRCWQIENGYPVGAMN
jgi:hypothetical protein